MLSRKDQFDGLRSVLEDQFQRQTDELTELTIHSGEPERNGHDPHQIATRIATTRQSLADTAQALRRIVEGTYGRCERCQADIPVERLEIRPHARYCVPCQRAVGA